MNFPHLDNMAKIAGVFGVEIVTHDLDVDLKAAVKARQRKVGDFPDVHYSDRKIDISRSNLRYDVECFNLVHEIGHLITCQGDLDQVVDWDDGRDPNDIERDSCVAQILILLALGEPEDVALNVAEYMQSTLVFNNGLCWGFDAGNDEIKSPVQDHLHDLEPVYVEIATKCFQAMVAGGVEPSQIGFRNAISRFRDHGTFMVTPWI